MRMVSDVYETLKIWDHPSNIPNDDDKLIEVDRDIHCMYLMLKQ